jgi:hypothetical protein
MPTCLIVPLACDLAQKGWSLGSDSRWRLNRAQELYMYGPRNMYGSKWATEDILFTVSAGMAPAKTFPKQTHSMAVMQRHYLDSLGIPLSQINVIFPTVWGTREEVKSALQYATTLNKEPLDIVFVSSWYHILRLKLLLGQCHRQGLVPTNATISFVASPGKLSNALKEPPKLLLQWIGWA